MEIKKIKQLIIEKFDLRLNKTINIPSSKSLSIRALILSSISSGKSIILNVLDCDDTNNCIKALKDLGVEITKQDEKISVKGCNNIYSIKNSKINVGSSGITCRFLLAILCVSLSKQNKEIEIIFDGTEQLRKRLIKPLVDSLLLLGADISYLNEVGFLSLKIKSKKLETSDQLEISGASSSQYVSAILMAAPLLEKQIKIHVTDIDAENHPYVKMAVKTMQDFGIKDIVFNEEKNIYTITPQNYIATNFVVETDFNTANYFFAFAAVTNSTIEVLNINKNTFQPGILFLNILEKIGCIIKYKKNSIKLTGPKKLKGGFKIDMFLMAEMATLLAVIATFADAPITICNVEHIRNHESDRISVISTELKKAGINVQEFKDGLTIEPGKAKFFTAETYEDHRIAMSLAILGIGANGINILNPSCVSKTCPEFFDLLEQLGVKIKYDK